MTTNPAVAAARNGRDQVRDLAHHTFPGTGTVQYPSEVYDIIGASVESARSQAQVCTQLMSWLRQEKAAGRIRSDFNRLDRDLAEAFRALQEAADLAKQLEYRFDRAHSATSSLAVYDPAHQ